jgi:hypothetical protein
MQLLAASKGALRVLADMLRPLHRSNSVRAYFSAQRGKRCVP